MLRIGFGYDLHPLVKNRPLMLGGIHIPFEKGAQGHSDGDTLLHAITDSLLGASGLGDIGELFPPTDMRLKNADSAKLLHSAWQMIQGRGWYIENIDCVIALERPKLLPFRTQIRSAIASTLGIQLEQVFVKAKTGEKLGEIGNGQAVAAWAVCLLSKD